MAAALFAYAVVAGVLVVEGILVAVVRIGVLKRFSQVRATLRAFSVASDDDARQRLSELNTRESQVVDLVAEGLSNAEIGRRLHMSETTIKTYVSRILAKLGCANRVQAALLVRDARAI